MIALRDRSGRLWTGRLDFATAREWKTLAGLDVMGFGPEADYDAATAALAVYLLCVPRSERRQMTGAAFRRAFRGRFWGYVVSPAEMLTAVYDEVGEFFRPVEPQPVSERTDDGDAADDAPDPWSAAYRFAGVAGVDPGPFTFGELAALARRKREHDWAIAAHLRADIHNNAYGRRTPVDPADFDLSGGLRRSGRGSGQSVEITGDNLDLLASVFRRN